MFVGFIGRLLLAFTEVKQKAATLWLSPEAMKMILTWATASPTLAQVCIRSRGHLDSHSMSFLDGPDDTFLGTIMSLHDIFLSTCELL